ncbi:MAG TPA: multidrug transporter AcrB [Gammaproteobacteria bacterium]|nr:multidrug transporter AcrB [Gammaproteobacteria bacterium]
MSRPLDGLAGLAVRRPLLTVVANLLIIVAGLAALLDVEVRELPDVDVPMVTVSAVLPGAAPETMDAEVTRRLEGAVARVPGVQRLRSASEEDNARVRVEFAPGTDLVTAAADVREAVSRITRDLPERTEQITVVKADQNAEPIIRLAVSSDALDAAALTRRVENDILPDLLAVDGVASIDVFGNREQQMHVVIDPLRLARFGLTVSDVATALRGAPFDIPIGSFRSAAQELLVRVEATAASPERIEAVVVRGDTRVGDVADAFLAPARPRNLVRLDGATVVGLGVLRRAQSNTIAISAGIHERIARMNARYQDLRIEVTQDEAVFIHDSVTEVVQSLLFSIVIVVLTLWLFFGALLPTLLPSAAIPTALIGAVAGLWLCGFSINLLTLLALVLATGLIVDDAIVVIENIQRLQAQGVRPGAAALLGTRQVFFAVIATTAVLAAVFVPIAFLPTLAGRLFREFALVLVLAMLISGFVALSLVPAVAAHLRLHVAGRGGGALASGGAWVARGYAALLQPVLAHPRVVLLAGALLAALAGQRYVLLEQELVPREDRGVIFVFAQGPDGTGLEYMDRQAAALEAILAPYRERGEIRTLFTVVGLYDPNRVGITAPLAPWASGRRPQQVIIEELQARMAQVPGVRVSVVGRSGLDLGGREHAGLEVALLGTDYAHIHAQAKRLAEAIDTRSDSLHNAEISYQPTQPQLSVQIDRRRAADLGVALDDISVTLAAMVGGQRIAFLNVEDRALPILLESATGLVRDPGDLGNLTVRSGTGELIPLSMLAWIEETGVAAQLDRVAQRRAIEVEADLRPGVALGEAIEEIRRLAAQTLDSTLELVLQGKAEALEETRGDLDLTYLFALIIVAMVLVAQFEGLLSPLIVLLSVPFGLAAAIFTLDVTGISLNIYSQIGLVMLIGLMAKNAILVVEFADQQRSQGLSVREAIHAAACIRLRPIMMTLLSTVIGALPLVLASGAGAEARLAIGWVVFGGLGIAGLFTLFLTPALYVCLAGLGRARDHNLGTLEQELREARTQLGPGMERAA